ncbi:MAG: DnaJ C-terminal domain-containing protein [Candidatus Spechtbacterales bacterium]
MAKDYYSILGVPRDASQEDIKKAYRKLAHAHHPDRGGEEAKFKEVNEAYQILGNAKKRTQYDQFGGAFDGSAGGPGGFQGSAWQGNYTDFQDMFGGGLGDIFEQFFGGAYSQTRTRTRGNDVQINLDLTLEEAFKGLHRDLAVNWNASGTKTVAIDIPAGIAGGDVLRISRMGEAAPVEGGQAGDLYVHVQVLPHRQFTRRGDDIITHAEVAFSQVALGAKISVPTLEGSVKLSVPAGTQSGELIRLRGKGMPKRSGQGRGDEYVKLQVVTPTKLSKKQKDLLEELGKESS